MTQQCATCKGRKTVILPADKSPLGIAAEVDCPECQSTGETGNPSACQRCNDSKTVVMPAEESQLGMAMEVDCPECSEPVVLE